MRLYAQFSRQTQRVGEYVSIRSGLKELVSTAKQWPKIALQCSVVRVAIVWVFRLFLGLFESLSRLIVLCRGVENAFDLRLLRLRVTARHFTWAFLHTG